MDKEAQRMLMQLYEEECFINPLENKKYFPSFYHVQDSFLIQNFH